MRARFEQFLEDTDEREQLVRHLLQLVRFGSVGVTSTLVYLAVFWCFRSVIDQDWLCGAAAYAPSMLVNYLLHRSFTFRSDRSHGQAGPRYLVVQAAGMAINSLGLWVGGDLMGLPYWASQLLALAVLASVSYLGQHLWTFQPKQR